MPRESPWGALEVADAHVHFFSRPFFAGLASQKAGASQKSGTATAASLAAIGTELGWQIPGSAEELASVWAQELDRHQIGRAALIASFPGDEASVIAAAHAHPGRFFKYAMLDPVHPWREQQLEEIDAACLFPAMHQFSLHSSEARRVFKWAAANRRALFVHCGMLSVGVRKKLGLESRFDMRYSNPIDLHPLALEFATVPIIVPHFGAGYFREALMLADACPNVFLDTSSSNSWMRTQESAVDLRQVFKRALDVAGPHRLLFGTDSSFFPRGWHGQIFEHQATALYELGASLPDAQSIFGENLLRIFAR